VIYKLGQALNRPQEEIAIYGQRAMNYKNLFDPTHNLMRGKHTDGSLRTPFNPTDWSRDFTEGNSWHYSWSVLHDPQGLIDLMGSKQVFNQMLDSVFIVPGSWGMKSRSMIHEMREMQVMDMGQYAHGNQPIQHMVFLYNYSGEPWKAQYWTREIMDKLYSYTPDGYCGDEDNGQTSAWYVFSALGFYPVCPGTDQYILGSPLFESAKIHLENGKQITIKANNNGEENRYIQSMKVNGKNYTLINRAYCIRNPKGFEGYGENSWGLTASYSVVGYAAHEPSEHLDFGVIAPTAALSSIVYTPEESMKVMRNFYYKGDKLWGPYGFYDAFSVTDDWYPQRYLAIDQGPIAVMIENYRSGLLWNLFMSHPDVQMGLNKLGFDYQGKK